MSSREIAELLGCRHDNVKRTIERLVDRDVIGFPPLEEYLDTLGRKATEYRIGKRDSYVIVAQLSPEFTARLVDRWQELEEQVAQKPALPQTFAEALRLAAELEEQKEALRLQNEAMKPPSDALRGWPIIRQGRKSAPTDGWQLQGTAASLGRVWPTSSRGRHLSLSALRPSPMLLPMAWIYTTTLQHLRSRIAQASTRR